MSFGSSRLCHMVRQSGREVAEAVAVTLRERGLVVTLKPMGRYNTTSFCRTLFPPIRMECCNENVQHGILVTQMDQANGLIHYHNPKLHSSCGVR